MIDKRQLAYYDGDDLLKPKYRYLQISTIYLRYKLFRIPPILFEYYAVQEI